MFHAVFFHKRISHPEMPRVSSTWLAGNEMVIDQDSPIRIPELCESHLLKLLRHKGDKNIMDHHPIHIYGDNITGFYILLHVIHG